MITKFDPVDSLTKGSEPLTAVTWSEKYAVGIDLIDNQHRQLVNLTNELYQACLVRDEALGSVFKEAMGRMVEYVRFHFTAELELLHRIKFPDYPEHKKQHDELVRKILDAAGEYSEGKKFVPNNFVRILKDWVFGHIAIYDQNYAAYVKEQKHKGLLTDEQING